LGAVRSNGAPFDDLECPQTPVSRSQYSLKADISQTVHPIDPLHVWFKARVFGVGGSNGTISSSIISQMASDGHLGNTAMSRVTLASAGLSCSLMESEIVHRKYPLRY